MIPIVDLRPSRSGPLSSAPSSFRRDPTSSNNPFVNAIIARRSDHPHTYTVARKKTTPVKFRNISVVNDNQQSKWEMLNFDPATNREPLKRSSPNLACVITSWILDMPSTKKSWAQSVKGFLLPICAKYTPRVRYATHVYYFFGSSNRP